LIWYRIVKAGDVCLWKKIDACRPNEGVVDTAGYLSTLELKNLSYKSI